MSDLIEIEARKVHETTNAWFLDVGMEDPIWFPKSACEFDGETLTLTEALAIEKRAMTNREFRYNLAKEIEFLTVEELDNSIEELKSIAGAKLTFRDGLFKISMYGREARAEGRCVNALQVWLNDVLLHDAPSEVAA